MIKEAILKEQKEPKMAKDKAKKRSDIESKRAKKGQPKDIKEERFTKEAIKMPKHLDIFCISEKLLYMSVHVKTVDKNIRTFLLSHFPDDESSIFVELQAIIISSSILSTYFYQCVRSSFHIQYFASNHQNCTD